MYPRYNQSYGSPESSIDMDDMDFDESPPPMVGSFSGSDWDFDESGSASPRSVGSPGQIEQFQPGQQFQSDQQYPFTSSPLSSSSFSSSPFSSSPLSPQAQRPQNGDPDAALWQQFFEYQKAKRMQEGTYNEAELLEEIRAIRANQEANYGSPTPLSASSSYSETPSEWEEGISGGSTYYPSPIQRNFERKLSPIEELPEEEDVFSPTQQASGGFSVQTPRAKWNKKPRRLFNSGSFSEQYPGSPPYGGGSGSQFPF